jgi:uncharacterized membrane protein
MPAGQAEQSALSREHRRRLRYKTIVFLVLMALLGPLSNILFRAGMERVGSLPAFSPFPLLHYGWRMMTNGFLVLGTGMRILFTVASFLVLSWADYSFVTPVSSVNYAIVAIMASIFLGEAVSPARWVGIVVICIGVALVGITPASTTETPAVPGSQILKPAQSSVGQEQ